ncbi:MAG: aminopeptidase N, partial [Nostocoides sp.]
ARARAARPDPAAKAAAWAEGVEDVRTPNSVIGALAHGFARASDPTLLEPYVATFLDRVIDISATRTFAVAEEINGFYPARLAGPGLLDTTNAWLAAHPDAPAPVRRAMSENRDAVARATAAQERDRKEA